MWTREEPKPMEPGANQQQYTPGTADAKPGEARDGRTASLGRSVMIKGTLSGSEDLTVDGHVEGRIDLPEHTLVIGPNANIEAAIVAKSVLVFGKVSGSITAHDRLDIRTGASVEGEVTCARISIQDGAGFSGKVAMGTRRPKSNGADGRATPVLAAAV